MCRGVGVGSDVCYIVAVGVVVVVVWLSYVCNIAHMVVVCVGWSR